MILKLIAELKRKAILARQKQLADPAYKAKIIAIITESEERQ